MATLEVNDSQLKIVRKALQMYDESLAAKQASVSISPAEWEEVTIERRELMRLQDSMRGMR